MVQVIGNLVFDLLGIRILGSYDDLSVLLSDLLQDLVDPLIEKIVRIRTFFRMFLPVINDIVNILENMKRIRVIIGSSCKGPVEAASVSMLLSLCYLSVFQILYSSSDSFLSAFLSWKNGFLLFSIDEKTVSAISSILEA